jgi:hypothetical protein
MATLTNFAYNEGFLDHFVQQSKDRKHTYLLQDEIDRVVKYLEFQHAVASSEDGQVKGSHDDFGDVTWQRWVLTTFDLDIDNNVLLRVRTTNKHKTMHPIVALEKAGDLIMRTHTRNLGHQNAKATYNWVSI